METPQQTIGRLLAALEVLTGAENHLLETGFPDDAIAVQQRAQPLVEKIAALLVSPGVSASLDAPLQTRVQTLLKSREHQLARLSAQMEATQTELEKLNAAQIRARQLRPIYRQPAAASFAAEG